MKDSLTKTICFIHSATGWTETEQEILAACKEEMRKGNRVILVTSMASQLGAKAIQERVDVYKFRLGKLSYLNPFKLLVLTLFMKTKSVSSINVTNKDDLKLGEILTTLSLSRSRSN